MIRRILLRTIIVLALAVSVGVALAAATPQGRVSVRTLLFLPQVLPAIPVKPQEWVTRRPTRVEVRFPLASGSGVADLYTPTGGKRHSAMLLFLGVNPAGRDDPRVVGLAEGLARAGVVVMIPWSDAMTQKRVSVEEIDTLVRAFEYLGNLDSVDGERMGMGGFCVGASFAAVAAQDERIRDQVKFVNFFAGYYSASDLVKSVVTKSRSYGGNVEPWSPDKLSVDVVTAHLIEGLQNPEERRLLTRRFIEQARGESIDPAALSPQASAVYRLLEGPGLEKVDALLEQLSPETQAWLRRISPSSQIHNLKARVLIMHDREDRLVPSEESRRLAEALVEDRNPYYTEFSLFQHVDPTKPVSPPIYAREVFKLFLHMYNILRELS